MRQLRNMAKRIPLAVRLHRLVTRRHRLSRAALVQPSPLWIPELQPSYIYELEKSIRRWKAMSAAGVEHPVDQCAFKLIAYELAERHGVRHPEVLGVFESPSQVDWEALPRRFALKLTQGWSSHGVRLLQKKGCGYSDLRRGDTLTVAELSDWLASTEASQFWIEEALYPLPDDWKCYAFNGVIGLVVRIDRQAGVYQTYDAELRPAPGVYRAHFLREVQSMGGPEHARELLETARILSRSVRHPHCSVDMYDMPNGIYVGEITALPGAGRRIVGDWDVRLGRLWEEAEMALILEGFPPWKGCGSSSAG